MSGRTGPTRTARWVASLAGAAVVAAAVALSSCGVPEGGSVRTVDDDAVPYRLLDPESASTSGTAGTSPGAATPAVFWVTGDQLEPEPTDDACTIDAGLLVDRLLASLTAGPSEEARAAGRSSALPTDFKLALLAVDGGTAKIEIQAGTSLSAEQLPLAVAQVVLTVTTAPAVRSVLFFDDGEPVQAPLPGGALTEGPVMARDYVGFVPDRLRPLGSTGCPPPRP
ncbi:hypothetical protein ASC77_25075 [Nocardioides sp. Root1257]|uniref:GerMN domain-containing protein n=1 Tax=unclassified Nocardioides TaxID=2615069 RepID=UPI0006F81392|nr:MULTISPECIES: GerMN domain-containing protein [unclassified Nocardioides]KQW50934.1 hypothetical protein ASC77_25075 [Nocardioides sp. Root1257]KRC53730.1 hypothetical protein ASE24_24865 [Nocardioides sp. Root224]